MQSLTCFGWRGGGFLLAIWILCLAGCQHALVGDWQSTKLEGIIESSKSVRMRLDRAGTGEYAAVVDSGAELKSDIWWFVRDDGLVIVFLEEGKPPLASFWKFKIDGNSLVIDGEDSKVTLAKMPTRE